MNRLAVITSFLGETRNRYMVYQPNRSLSERFAMLSEIKGVDGVELCYPADFENMSELKEVLKRSAVAISGVNFRSRRRRSASTIAPSIKGVQVANQVAIPIRSLCCDFRRTLPGLCRGRVVRGDWTGVADPLG